MTASRYARSPVVAEVPEPAGWGRHLGVSDEVADGLDSGQLGALIFVRKLVRCWYIANVVLAVSVWAGIGLWARVYGEASFGNCAAVSGLTSHCDPGMQSLILGLISGFVVAAVVFTAASLPCLVLGYAVRWSARAMADRNEWRIPD
ncbi:hypothetical protein [Nocardia aurantiaca]|uniref:Uncharacterized protein n=1 Tax=Nocardia aurantiaca TaxID=2675850 RepID=A0A6I3L071_9NOCA|nr:hypothetical protein [Nocardia aurantiaca]MTE16363.1 hypothetical protein [Nocardia aurantiaca]